MSALLDALCGQQRLADIVANEAAMEIPAHAAERVCIEQREQPRELPAMEPEEQ